MLSKWPIRNKLLLGLSLLLVTVATLSWCAFYGLYAYRGLVKSLDRVAELRLATELSQRVGELRIDLARLRGLDAEVDFSPRPDDEPSWVTHLARDEFRDDLAEVEAALQRYRRELLHNNRDFIQIGGSQRELEAVHQIENTLVVIHRIDRDEDWVLDQIRLGQLDRETEHLQVLAGRLPGYLHESVQQFTEEVRDQRRSFVGIAWTTSIATLVMLVALVQLFYKWVFRPLRILIKGSRKMASGQFDYRIHLDTRDEMSELAEALNDMTARFQDIFADLDQQVQERTNQVVRSEQLASVGFLAAGVAHEINNPLASIALCAESLESRTRDLLEPDHPDHAIIGSYLKMIQEEAFRCKGITEKLLDFSRLGDRQRHVTELGELVQSVIDMVGHLGRYHDKRVEFERGEGVLAAVNPQEFKQVVLNLVTNALDSLDAGGWVRLELHQRRQQAELVVTDNGCGMTPEVLTHLFEPFFTRRRQGQGQGTGLGLSITYRIVSEHGGQIQVSSEGPGRGSQFRVLLPLAAPAVNVKESSHRYQAA